MLFLFSLCTSLIFYGLLFISLKNINYTTSRYEAGLLELKNQNYEKAYDIFLTIYNEANNFHNVQKLLDSSKFLYTSEIYNRGLAAFKQHHYEIAYATLNNLHKKVGDYRDIRFLKDLLKSYILFNQAESLFYKQDFTKSKEAVLQFISEYPKSPKLSDAKLLLEKVVREDKILKKEEERENEKATIQAEKESSIIRKNYAVLARNRFLDGAYNIQVIVYGKNNTIIKFTYALFDDVWAHKLKNSPLLSEIRDLGFRRLELSDGYNYGISWTFN